MNTSDLPCLLRSLAATPSRRGVARALTGFALAGLLSPLLGFTNVNARNRKKKRKNKKKCKNCDFCQTCKQGKCKPKPEGASCPGDRTCQGGQCLCPSGMSYCQNGPRPTCCPTGEACLSGSICGECPVTDFCDLSTYVGCGGVPGSQCICVTSIEGLTVCSNQKGICMECATDEECSAALNRPAVCVPVVGDDCNDTCVAQFGVICLQATCP